MAAERIRLHKGDIAGAEEALLAAHRAGWDPQPGLALVRLAQGDVATAAASIRDALEHPLRGAEVAFADDEDALRVMVAGRKKELAFSLGGMGSAQTNFYNNAYSRQGWAEVAAAIRERWQAGDRDGAVCLVTDEMVLATTLIGTEDMVRTRLGAWRDAGVDTVRLYPAGETLEARLIALARALDLVHAVG